MEGSHLWKLAKSQTQIREAIAYKNKKTFSQVYATEAFKRFDRVCKVRTKESLKVSLARLALGLRAKGASFHPDNFTFPDTAQMLVDSFKEKNGTDELNSSQKRIIRQYIDHCTEISLDKISDELRDMGVDGDKEKPSQSRLHMKPSQYIKVKKMLKQKSILEFVKFGFNYGTFCRPASKYIVELSQLSFYDRTVSYIEINNEKITDKRVIFALQDKYPVQTITHRAVAIENFM